MQFLDAVCTVWYLILLLFSEIIVLCYITPLSTELYLKELQKLKPLTFTVPDLVKYSGLIVQARTRFSLIFLCLLELACPLPEPFLSKSFPSCSCFEIHFGGCSCPPASDLQEQGLIFCPTSTLVQRNLNHPPGRRKSLQENSELLQIHYS